MARVLGPDHVERRWWPPRPRSPSAGSGRPAPTTGVPTSPIGGSGGCRRRTGSATGRPGPRRTPYSTSTTSVPRPASTSTARCTDRQHLVVDLGVAERRRPGHPARAVAGRRGRPTTRPRAGAATAGRSGRDRPPRRARPRRRTGVGPSAPWSTGSASPGRWRPPHGTRPSDGFMPDSPQHDEGIRIEPPPSDPVASGTMPDGDGRRAPPGRPPGGVLEVPRVEGRPEHRVLGVRLPAELRACWSSPPPRTRRPPAGPPGPSPAAAGGPSA